MLSKKSYLHGFVSKKSLFVKVRDIFHLTKEMKSHNCAVMFYLNIKTTKPSEY